MPKEYRDIQVHEVILRFRMYIESNHRPSVSGFAVGEFMARETIYDWAKRKVKDSDEYKWQELRELLAICKTKQRHALIEDGLDNKANARIVSLCLQTNHDFVNREEKQGNPERPLEVKPHNPADIAAVMRERVESEQES